MRIVYYAPYATTRFASRFDEAEQRDPEARYCSAPIKNHRYCTRARFHTGDHSTVNREGYLLARWKSCERDNAPRRSAAPARGTVSGRLAGSRVRFEELMRPEQRDARLMPSVFDDLLDPPTEPQPPVDPAPAPRGEALNAWISAEPTSLPRFTYSVPMTYTVPAADDMSTWINSFVTSSPPATPCQCGECRATRGES